MTKAIFLDVDGTLISFKTHRVPASALEALRGAHARGVQLFIATGRAAADLADLEAIPYDGVVALNGADCLMRDGRSSPGIPFRAPTSRSRSPCRRSWIFRSGWS
jgi:hydroxymethylpyrimidine pyrophosphatase-like HAD family hydrolase